MIWNRAYTFKNHPLTLIRMKPFAITLFLSLASFVLFAQDFEIPENYSLEKAEDYAPYEEDIMNCFEWLMETPVNEQEDKRQEANKFMLTWMMGSPSISVEISEKIVTFMGSSPKLLIIFLGGWTNYALANDHSEDKLEGTKAGIEAIIDFYTKNRKALSKDKNVEKYVKMKKAGTLDDYISNNV